MTLTKEKLCRQKQQKTNKQNKTQIEHFRNRQKFIKCFQTSMKVETHAIGDKLAYPTFHIAPISLSLLMIEAGTEDHVSFVTFGTV